VAKQRHEAGDNAVLPEWRKSMKNLSKLALEAHGGLKRWSQLKAVTPSGHQDTYRDGISSGNQAPTGCAFFRTNLADSVQIVLNAQ
jgi:hypothetical protein